MDLIPTMGKRAAPFWERIDWYPPPFFRDAVGPGNTPVDPYELFTRCPALQGDLEEAENISSSSSQKPTHLNLRLSCPGHTIRLTEEACWRPCAYTSLVPSFAATFVTQDGCFFVFTIMPEE